MADNETPSTVSVQTPAGSVSVTSKKMAELISVALTIVVGIMGYAVWDHAQDSKQTIGEFKDFLREMSTNNLKAMEKLSESQNLSTEAQREMNCLISLPQDERRKEFLGENTFCKRMSRR